MSSNQFDLSNLHERHPGLTKALAEAYCEAARVCLDRHHVSPVEVALVRHGTASTLLSWIAADERTRRAWANEIDATEAGAYAAALAAVESTDSLVAVSRAETLTGADYYLAPKGSSVDDLEAASRLEVSGIDRGTDSQLQARLRQKVAQAQSGRSSLPAIAAVVVFSLCQVAIADAAPTEA
ncbi:MAG TPA: hypothetical protein PLG77_03165 [Burkholderiaceae bacterium]|nr:hypothetical protein [Burkholderiaceae bacterium]